MDGLSENSIQELIASWQNITSNINIGDEAISEYQIGFATALQTSKSELQKLLDQHREQINKELLKTTQDQFIRNTNSQLADLYLVAISMPLLLLLILSSAFPSSRIFVSFCFGLLVVRSVVRYSKMDKPAFVLVFITTTVLGIVLLVCSMWGTDAFEMLSQVAGPIGGEFAGASIFALLFFSINRYAASYKIIPILGIVIGIAMLLDFSNNPESIHLVKIVTDIFQQMGIEVLGAATGIALIEPLFDD